MFASFAFLIIFIWCFDSKKSADNSIKDVLFHLKPRKSDIEVSLKNKINLFLDKVDLHFNESNISTLYESLQNDSEIYDIVSSIYHNWGLGVSQDPRISVLHLNLGVLNNDTISTLSYAYKSFLGINVPESCQAHIGYVKSIVDEVSKNFSLFERKMITTSNAEQISLNSDIKSINSFVDNIEEIGLSNDYSFNKYIRQYFTYSYIRSHEMTKKIISYLKNRYIYAKSPKGATYLAIIYLITNEENADYVNITKMLEYGASEKVPFAYLGLGVVYFYGLGVEIDYDRAFKYFIRANHSGINEATTYIGICYLAGLGVVSDTKAALFHIVHAANKGYLLALYTLGVMHEKGIGVFHSCKFAHEMYLVIVENKIIREYITRATQDYKDNLKMRAFFKLLLLSELGSPESMVRAATILESNSFYFYNQSERSKNTFKLWKLASSLRNPRALVKVGNCYFYGFGVDQDYKNAFSSYQHAASAYYDPEAIYNMAFMYEYGLGTIKNIPNAIRFYQLVARVEAGAKALVSFNIIRLQMKSLISDIVSFCKGISLFFNQLIASFVNFIFFNYEPLLLSIGTITILIIVQMHHVA